MDPQLQETLDALSKQLDTMTLDIRPKHLRTALVLVHDALSKLGDLVGHVPTRSGEARAELQHAVDTIARDR
jgi:hypothetical protein